MQRSEEERKPSRKGDSAGAEGTFAAAAAGREINRCNSRHRRFPMKALITVVSATLLSAAAMAGDGMSKTTAATFEALDKNADQQISKTEAAAEKNVSDAFAMADTNGDGYLSKSEYMTAGKSHDKPKS
jgi:EF hand